MCIQKLSRMCWHIIKGKVNNRLTYHYYLENLTSIENKQQRIIVLYTK